MNKNCSTASHNSNLFKVADLTHLQCFELQKISEKCLPGDSFLFLHQDPLNPRLAPHLWHAWREPCLTLGLGPVVSEVALGPALKASRHGTFGEVGDVFSM